MMDMGAVVTVYDIDRKAAEELSRRIPVKIADDANLALSQHILVLNACPGAIDGRFVKEGAIISSPGIPFPFDGLGIKRAETIINDPLDIGVVVMAVQSASFSRMKKQ
jgi:pyrrolysine biosynthesis protein PylD